MNSFPRIFAVLGLLALMALLIVPGVRAQGPDGRPYLELPFEGGSAYRVSCGYTCYQHYYSMTYAVDFAVPVGVPILAAAGGEVMAITWEVGMPLDLNLGDALIVYIDHGGGWFTRYVHLDGITVQVGDHVEMGDVIGYSGTTGASAAHLHFELRYGNSLRSPSVPIDELFGGEPLVGRYYESHNYPLAASEPVPAAPPVVDGPAPAELPQVALVPTVVPSPPVPLAAPIVPTPLQAGGPAVAETVAPGPVGDEGGLAISAEADELVAGEPFTVSFTARNDATRRTTFSLVGVGSRKATPVAVPGDARESNEAVLSFDRSITLNPGRSYDFSKAITLEEPGTYELFVFMLDDANRWITPEGGASQLEVTVAPASPHVYLPLVLGLPSAASPEESAPQPSATPTLSVPTPAPTPPAVVTPGSDETISGASLDLGAQALDVTRGPSDR